MIRNIILITFLFALFVFIAFTLKLAYRYLKTYRKNKIAKKEAPPYFRSDKEINILVILGTLALALGNISLLLWIF